MEILSSCITFSSSCCRAKLQCYCDCKMIIIDQIIIVINNCCHCKCATLQHCCCCSFDFYIISNDYISVFSSPSWPVYSPMLINTNNIKIKRTTKGCCNIHIVARQKKAEIILISLLLLFWGTTQRVNIWKIMTHNLMRILWCVCNPMMELCCYYHCGNSIFIVVIIIRRWWWWCYRFLLLVIQ